MFKAPPAVQDEPSYSSVLSTLACPPKTSPAVNVPAPPPSLVAVPRSPPAVQSVPSYSSVLPSTVPSPVYPAAATEAV